MLNSTSLLPRPAIRGFLMLSCLALVSGCGGYSGDTGTVAGTVTLNGSPAPSGTLVTFIAAEGFAASGVVGDGGAYEVTMPDMGKQIPAVNYKVMVSAPVTGGVSSDSSDYEAYMQSVNADATSTGAQPKPAIPAKFTSTATSGLSFDVSQGENTINIELK